MGSLFSTNSLMQKENTPKSINKMKEELKKYPVIVRLPVQWGEMDSAAHVNNLVYMRWTETGRIVYFEKWEWIYLLPLGRLDRY